MSSKQQIVVPTLEKRKRAGLEEPVYHTQGKPNGDLVSLQGKG